MDKPDSARIRLTISVPPEVHATFERMAKASRMSISRAMGDWLADTLEAAEMTTTMVERARSTPKQVILELNAIAHGFADETGSALRNMRERPGPGGSVAPALRGVAQGVQRAAEPLRHARSAASPPSSNTGGKVPKRGAAKGRPR